MLIKRFFCPETLAFSVMVLWPVRMGAQEPLRLTLTECVQRAIIHHPRLGLAESEVRVRESVLEEARAARTHPQADLKVLVGPVPSALGSPYDPNLRTDFSDLSMFTRAEINGLLPIYTFGKLEAKTDAARLGVEAARHGRDQVLNEIRWEVQRLYYALVLARETRGLIDEVLEKVGEARRRVQNGISQGTGQFTPSDRYRLEVFGSELEARRVAVDSTAAALLATLKAAVGLPKSVDFDIADSALKIPSRDAVDAEGATEQAIQRRPELAQLRDGDAARAALVRSARADLYPQFFAGALLRYSVAPNRTIQRNPFIRDDFNFLNGGFAVGFQYSFNFAGTRAKVREAVAERDRLHAQRKLAETAIDLETTKAALTLHAAASITDVRGNAARVARGWLAAAESNFNLGVEETRELVDAFEAYTRTRGSLLQAIHDEKVAEAELEYAKGGN
jgi:outer membrane protein TolC